jgi:hypothetical protein
MMIANLGYRKIELTYTAKSTTKVNKIVISC